MAKRRLSKSSKVVEVLRFLFPGEWRFKGRVSDISPTPTWAGPNFDVILKDGKYIRSDTGLEVKWPKLRSRNHFIHDILAQKLGGTWTRSTQNERAEWSSPDHNFIVYSSNEYIRVSDRTSPSSKASKARQVYRRSDTQEIVYRAAKGKRLYPYDN